VNEIQAIEPGHDTFICRICEQVVPLGVLDDHSRLCIRAHRSHFQFYRCDAQLKPIRARVGELLDCPWPGALEPAVNVIFPVLSFHWLVSLAIDVRLCDADASENLTSIAARMRCYFVPEEATSLLPTFLAGKLRVDLKMHACLEIQAAERERQKTTVVRRH
jgi:hypothetical protein